MTDPGVVLGGAFAYPDRYDWRNPRAQVTAKNSAGVLTDISDRVTGFSVTLNNPSSCDKFTLNLSNKDGYISDNFTYGKEINIYATFDQYDQEQLLSGRVEDPETSFSKSGGATATFAGKDWTGMLQNPIALEVYKKGSFTAGVEPYVGEMVRDFIAKYCPKIDASLVPNTSVQIAYKIFARMTVYDCIKFFADLLGYRFYVNTGKQLIFEPKPTPLLVSATFGGSGDPTGWTENSGTWAQSAGQYSQTNATGSFTSYRTVEDYDDLLIDAYLTIDSGSRAGFAFRIDASGNCYFVALDITENLVKLYRVTTWSTDEEIMVATPASTLALATQYHVRIFEKTKSGSVEFKVYIDDMLHSIMHYADDIEFTASGKVGLRTEDAAASFDNFTAANAYLVIEEAFNAKDIGIKSQLSRQKNRVTVTGGYEKFPVQEVITPSGSTDTITLTYAPSQCKVSVTGESGNPQKGGISGIDDSDVTVYWLMDYYQKKLIRRGGNWLAASTTIDYLRSVPLQYTSEDSATFDANDIRDFCFTDNTLNTQALVEDRADALLAVLNEVPRTGSSSVVSAVWLVARGDYVLVKSPKNGISSYEMMRADSISVSFDKSSGLVYKFTLDNENASIALLLNSLDVRLRKLERRDVPETLIHDEYLTDSASIQDAITGEKNTISAGFKLGMYAKLGHSRKLGATGTGWSAAF